MERRWQTLPKSQAQPGRPLWVAQVQLHELSHQWMGDLVTPRWWDDLGVAEGRAEFWSGFLPELSSGDLKAWPPLLNRKRGALEADGLLVAEMLKNPSARDKLWARIQSDWQTLSPRLSGIDAPALVLRAIGGLPIAQAASIRAFLEKVKNEANANPVKAALDLLEQAIAGAKDLERTGSEIRAWLAANGEDQ